MKICITNHICVFEYTLCNVLVFVNSKQALFEYLIAYYAYMYVLRRYAGGRPAQKL